MQFTFSYFVNFTKGSCNEANYHKHGQKIEGEGGTQASSNMALLSKSRFRINRIMISASPALQFLILWFKINQSISKFRRKASAIKKKVIKGFNITFANKTEFLSVFKSQGIPPFKPSHAIILN